MWSQQQWVNGGDGSVPPSAMSSRCYTMPRPVPRWSIAWRERSVPRAGDGGGWQRQCLVRGKRQRWGPCGWAYDGGPPCPSSCPSLGPCPHASSAECLGTVSLCAAADGGCPDTCARCVTGVWGPLCAPLSWALCPWQGPPSAAPRGGLTAAPRAPAQGHAWLGQEGTPGHTLPWAAAHVLPTLGGAAEAPSSSSLPPGAPTPLLTHCGRGGQPPPCHPPLHSWVPRAVLA